MVMNVRYMMVVGVQITSSPQFLHFRRMTDSPKHLLMERIGIPVLENKTVLEMMDILYHAAVIGRDYRDAALLGLMYHKRRILSPDAGNDDTVDVPEHLVNEFVVHVLPAECNGIPAERCLLLECRRALAIVPAEDEKFRRRFDALKCIYQHVDSFGWNMRSYISESERPLWIVALSHLVQVI